jgi:hypothetical protein
MIEFADSLSKYRVFPRLFSLAYLYLLFEVADWYMWLEVPTTEQTGFAGIMIPTAAAWFKFYVDGGRSD